jgi:capsular polysaccharide export protein
MMGSGNLIMQLTNRHFLFLQGLRSPFFSKLGLAIKHRGAAVSKVNFNFSDQCYWPGEAIKCDASLEKLPAFYTHLFDQNKYTDIVLFGDCRPIHRPAVALVKQWGIRVHVIEEGYFRPDWVTLERNGVNGYSKLPKVSEWYKTAATQVPNQPLPLALKSGFKARVLHDVAYNATGILNKWLYPNYCSHIPYTIFAEYKSYMQKFFRSQKYRSHDTQFVEEQCNKPCDKQAPYYLLTLQISSDSQLQFHSNYKNPEQLLSEVMVSFAQYAPPETQLIIKSHPLDPGFINYRQLVQKISKPLNLVNRVILIETGHLPTLLDHALGMVTVNSTSIGQALFHHCPVIALGESVFNMPNLTFQDGLDRFWSNPGKVDTQLFRAIQSVFMYATQIHGGLYSREGIELAVHNAIPVLFENESRLEGLLRQIPCIPIETAAGNQTPPHIVITPSKQAVLSEVL